MRLLRRQPRWRIQLRNPKAPSDWRQTVAEIRDRELPWLRCSWRQICR